MLLCEIRLLLLKARPLKKKSFPAKELSDRNSTRGFLAQFLSPYFKDAKGNGCWTDNFTTPLSISQCFYGTSKQKSYIKVAEAIREYLVDEIIGKYNLSALIASVMEKDRSSSAINDLRSAEDGIRAARKKSEWELLGSDVDREFDWMKIATREIVQGISASDCQGIWNMVLKPQYKFKCWTKQRQQLLKELAIQHRFQCWEDVARGIGGGMTGFLAFTQFLMTHGHLLNTNGTWLKEDDNHLLSVVKASTIGGEILWRKVMYYLEDRTPQQCITRWYKINPAMKKGRFSENEDALLLHCVDKFGCDFIKITSVFGNRTLAQIRERVKALKTSLDQKTGEWSVEEDELLLALVKKYGESKWSEISNEMPSRNRVQIRQRYSSVLKKKLMKTPELDLTSIQRSKRGRGTISKETAKSLIEDANITGFIKDKVAGGRITVRTPVHPGRKSKGRNSK
ncbi:hypothetical protein GE061_006597 [Apolygus lucorum]|uniref:Myb-like domain-containing protein n=1 Tax=Apolygus lucorum TaxID=248454 RepID=A0A8S9WVQ0_APOLU|nr:hypothetical protein GE061_006597 [Apolygus lucorum]